MVHTMPTSLRPDDRFTETPRAMSRSTGTSQPPRTLFGAQNRRIAILGVPSKSRENAVFRAVFRAKLSRMNYLQCIVLDKACGFITLQKPWCIFHAHNASQRCPNASASSRRGSAVCHSLPSPDAPNQRSAANLELFGRFASGNSIATLCYPTVIRNVARYPFQARK
jgi:hypothetical protein